MSGLPLPSQPQWSVRLCIDQATFSWPRFSSGSISVGAKEGKTQPMLEPLAILSQRMVILPGGWNEAGYRRIWPAPVMVTVVFVWKPSVFCPAFHLWVVPP
ncbi:hypothetical protein ACH4SK_38835 [Streptomyces inhibens]|uniref:hypothetical protein n=1 Tax=Streptomyces inhibens TaxID=2293571 RepID=UPI0037A30DF3